MFARTMIAAMTAVLFSQVCVGADDPKAAQRSAMVFRRLDTNKDGMLSKAEFEAAAEKVAQQGKGQGRGGNGARLLERLDTDRNGFLSPAEFEKLQSLRGQTQPRAGKAARRGIR